MKKGKEIARGKTKIISEDEENPDQVIIENGDALTKHDDPAQTRTMERKAEISTLITCIIFEILKLASIPLAYIKQLSKTTFLAVKCQMLPLEVIVRRYAVGSYLSRYPELKRDGIIPHRFGELLCEVFLKTTGGAVISKDGVKIFQLPIDPETKRVIDDPLIANPKAIKWDLYHPKKPIGRDSYLCSIYRDEFLPDNILIEDIMMMACKVFLILEEFLSLVQLRLIDFKVEFGVGPDGKLRLADVIDNDSWRLRTFDWRELSKELFRQNVNMEKIQESYEYVAQKLQEAFKLR